MSKAKKGRPTASAAQGQPVTSAAGEQKRNMTLPGILSAIAVLAVFVVLGVMLSSRPDGQEGASAASEQPTAGGSGPRRTYSARPEMTIDPTKDYRATITTPRGDIVIRLRPDIAPQTVNSFVFLSREGFYNGLTWHRVIANFMAQGGDPDGTGRGGPGYNVPAEFTDKVLFDRPGIVAMARRGDDINSAGSQFFITTAAYPSLNSQYTIFGEVIQGQEIVENIPLRDPMRAATPGEEIVSITIEES